MPTTTTGIATEFIQFTRASNATVTDSDGLVKWAPHNLLLNSESFDTSSWTKTTTTVAANSIAAPNGTTTADTLTASGANGTTLQSYTALAIPYTFAVWLRRKTGTGNIQIAADSGTYTTVTITSSWALYTVSQTPAAGTISAGIRIVTSADEVYVWGAALYRSDLAMQPNTSAYPLYNPTTPKNLLGYTENFSNAYWTNSATTITTSATTAPNALLTANKIVATATLAFHARYVVIAVGSAVYTLSVYAKAAEYSLFHIGDRVGATYGAAFDLVSGTVVAGTTGGTNYVSSAITPVGNGWYRCSVVFSNLSGNAGPTFVGYPSSGVVVVNNIGAQYTGDGVSGVYIWGAQLSDSASLDTYAPVYGAAVTSAAYYGPRRDFNASTLACNGLLVEESRTNLLLQSAAFNVTWSILGSSASIGVDSIASPSGQSTADGLVEGAFNDFQAVQQVISTTGGVTYSASCFVKAGVRNFVLLDCYEGASTYASVSFNLTTGVVHASAVAGTGYAFVGTPVVTPYGSGWYRCSFAFVAGSSAPVRFAICASDTGSISSFGVAAAYLGTNNNAIYLWGAQLEESAPFVTSYIPTGSASATRTYDLATVSTQAFPYSTSEGTLVVAAQYTGVPTSFYSYYTGLYSGSGVSDLASVATDAGFISARVRSSSSDSLSNTFGSTMAVGSVKKVGIALKVNDFATVLNGGTAAVSTTGAMPVGIITLNMNIYNSGAQWIRQITYLPRRVTNAELQTRTA